MKAIVQNEYGKAEDVLRLEEPATPDIGDDEVLLHVRAAGVDRGTWHITTGLPYPIRVAGFGLHKPKYLNPGRSLAGTVHAVGSGVTTLRPGDEVYGIGRMLRRANLIAHDIGAHAMSGRASMVRSYRDAASLRVIASLMSSPDRLWLIARSRHGGHGVLFDVAGAGL